MKSKLKIPKDVYAILEKEIESKDLSEDKVCSDLFENAMDLIDRYEVATNANDIPSAFDLGKACTWLLMLMQIYEDKHWSVVIKLLSSSSGVSLFQIKPSVIEIRNEAEAALKAILEKLQQQQEENLDPPF